MAKRVRPSLVLMIALLTAPSRAVLAATQGVPMSGSDPSKPWFDWIFFGIVIPFLLFAIWDYIQTSRSK